MFLFQEGSNLNSTNNNLEVGVISIMSSNIKFDDYSLDNLDVDIVSIESRYVLDGASTLSEAAELARFFAEYLENLEAEGYELTDVISQGKGRASQDIVETIDSLF